MSSSSSPGKVYKFISSEEQIQTFYEKLFALTKERLGDEPRYFQIHLMGREKYLDKKYKFKRKGNVHIQMKEMYSNQSSKQTLQKIRQFECSFGSYLVDLEERGLGVFLLDQPIPNECLVLYTSINPPNFKEVHAEMIKKILLGGMTHDQLFKHLPNEYASNASKSSLLLKDLDVDTKNPEHLQLIYDGLFKGDHSLEEALFDIIETKNGFHILYKSKGMTKELWNRINQCLEDCKKYTTVKKSRVNEDVKDLILTKNEGSLVPLPGTFQNEFSIRSISLKEFESRLRLM